MTTGSGERTGVLAVVPDGATRDLAPLDVVDLPGNRLRPPAPTELAPEVRRRLPDVELTDTTVDLDAEPPDRDLAARVGHRTCLFHGWVPWRLDETGDVATLVVAAVGRPDPESFAGVRELYAAGRVEVRRTTPTALRSALAEVHREVLLHEAGDRLATRFPRLSARSGLTTWQRWFPAVLLVALVVGLVRSPTTAIVVTLAVANLLFVTNVVFKTVAVSLMPFRAAHRSRQQLEEMQARVEAGLSPQWAALPPEDELPVYTVLVPAYDEANVVETLVANLSVLDYPPDKLDVMLLLEADDEATIAAAQAADLPPFVEVVVVPPGTPQTKPRACNYGLSLARGRYAVIYDAEDRPDPGQLKEAVAAFRRDQFEQRHGLTSKPPLAVVQASLHYFNADYNVLTRMFAIEYAHWFEAMLPGMDVTRLPLPLGGTSNHFDVDLLRDLGSWDPYNVTEDADAGLRTASAGYRVEMMDSSTGEEACAVTTSWIKQRTRWIKGYMMTAAVNLRDPWRFARETGPLGVISMLGLVAATPLAFLAYPLALALTIATYIGVQLVGLDLPAWLTEISVTTFVFGNLMMIVTTALVASWRYTWRIGIFAVFGPVYWLLHSVAAWRALHQVLFDPHRWEKTPHGLTEDYESAAHV